MWAFLANFCLHSNFATSKMYISGNSVLQIAVNPYGVLEIDKYHWNPSFLLGNLHLSCFATKFGPILSKYFWVKVCFSSKTLKPKIQLLIVSRRRSRKSRNCRDTFCNQFQQYWSQMKPYEILRLLMYIWHSSEVGCLRFLTFKSVQNRK